MELDKKNIVIMIVIIGMICNILLENYEIAILGQLYLIWMELIGIGKEENDDRD